MKKICVFCGSSAGSRPEYAEAAEKLGSALVKNGIGLVYGGGKVGLMGRIASSVLERGGEVTGVIPEDLAEKEVAFSGVTDLLVVDSKHTRKALMAELSDGFIALPGGLGTLEEFFEMLTWGQLGIHGKPCGLLDINGYFGKLLDFLEHTATEQFVEKEHLSMILTDTSPEALIERFRTYRPPEVDKARWTLKMAGAR